jgi:hypothetical protein
MKVLDIPSSGSVNWRTASRNRNGQYIRNRSIPVQPRSTAQLAIRGMLVLAAQSWKSLSTADQMAWSTFGSLHPRTDALGQSNAPTGEQAFVGVCVTSQLLGDGLITGAPPPEPVMSAFVEGTLHSDASTFTITDYVCPTGGRVMVWASKPSSPGRHFFGQPTYLQSSGIDDPNPIDISTQLAARWGTVPMHSVIQITQIPVVNGIMGAKATSQVIIGSGTPMAAPVISTNFTAFAGADQIAYTVINAAVPEGVTSFQFQYMLQTDTLWHPASPKNINPAEDPNVGSVGHDLPNGDYYIQARWYAGTAPALPSAWSESAPVTLS